MATGATLAIRIALDEQLGGQPTLVIFTLPIVLSAYLGGLRAGLLSTALTLLGASYFLLPPIHSIAIQSGVERWQLFFVALAGVLISGLCEVLHRARRRADLATREHQQVEEALRASEERLQTVTENLSEGLVIADLDGRLVHWNRAGIEMLGFASREEGPRNLPDFHDLFELSSLDGAILPDDQWPLQRILGGERLRGLEVRIRRLQGDWQRVFSYSGAIVRDPKGHSVAFMSIGDITQRTEAQEKAVWLASFPERNPNPVLEVDLAAGVIHYANPAASRLLPDLEMLGVRHPVLAGLPEVERALRDEGADAVRREVTAGDFSWAQTISYIPETQRLRIYSLNITERKEAEARVLELNAELEHRVVERTAQLEAAYKDLEAFSTAVTRDLRVAEAADRVKSAFLATMSHELRTPLNSIIGFTGIVLMGKAGPVNTEQAKQLGMVRESAWHLLALINDVLDLSKIEAGQLEVRAEAFDLPASIGRVMAMIGLQAEKKGLKLGAVVARELGEMVSDQRRVEQILLNLLSNAVKFTDRGHVTLTADRLADFKPSPVATPGLAVRLRVVDTGIGISPKDVALLFDPFRQIDTGLARQAEGTGLGLAICRRLATLLGGEISVASRWSEGSEFTVILPLQRPCNP